MKYSGISLCLFWFVVFGSAQTDPGRELLLSDCMKSGSASILVYNLKSRKEVFAFDPDRAVPTASIQKMMTTAAALKNRGADFRYQTTIGYTGTINHGVLNGNIVVRGSGDPSLGSDNFEEGWTMEHILDTLLLLLQAQGITAVSGDVLLDISGVAGHHVPSGWPWSDLGNYYGAGHWAVNIHDNEYRLFFRQNEVKGKQAEVLRTLPDISPVIIESEVKTGPVGSGDQAYIYSSPHQTNAIVRGTIPPGRGSFSIRGSIPDPPAFFGRQIFFRLGENGIRVNGGIRSSTEPIAGVKPLWTIYSPPLSELARVTNFKSVNLYAEAILKLLCMEDETPSHYACGLEALKSFWSDHGVDPKSYFIRDGSGLSPRNTVSARSFIHALDAISKDPEWENVFLSTLPEMGKSGTLRYMLRGYSGSGVILAKSGYIGRQRSYAGYITTGKGEKLVFCIMLDNYSCSASLIRQRIERFLISFLD